jgi:hypothetical protein
MPVSVTPHGGVSRNISHDYRSVQMELEVVTCAACRRRVGVSAVSGGVRKNSFINKNVWLSRQFFIARNRVAKRSPGS